MISADKREEVLRRLHDGERDAGKIAAEVGVPKGTVASLKAWVTIRAKPTDVPPDDIAEAIETTFGLERDLQDALLKNISQLGESLTVSPESREYHVPAGRIDILATYGQGKRVVIELKAGTADRDAIGQSLSYIGDLRMANTHIPVRGILW
jgi:hypothetical protein